MAVEETTQSELQHEIDWVVLNPVLLKPHKLRDMPYAIMAAVWPSDPPTKLRMVQIL